MKKFNIAINILQIICNLIVVILLYILVDGFNAGIYREWAWVLIVVFISLPFSLWFSVYVYFGYLNKLKNKKGE